jgi:hypothetical protein
MIEFPSIIKVAVASLYNSPFLSLNAHVLPLKRPVVLAPNYSFLALNSRLGTEIRQIMHAYISSINIYINAEAAVYLT